MAVVYRARDTALDRQVAIKVLHAHLTSQPDSKARLQREARAVAKLSHDNIVEIFDYAGTDTRSAYIVSEFVDGETLAQLQARTGIGVPEIGALISLEIARALEHAHALGIIHRDVKPENVMVRKDGAVKLTDFGVAQLVDMERMTVTGQILGSPAYMAPEVVDGGDVDVRTDLFSLGVLLYKLTVGALPFGGRNPHEVLRNILAGAYTDPRRLNPCWAWNSLKSFEKGSHATPKSDFKGPETSFGPLNGSWRLLAYWRKKPRFAHTFRRRK